MEEKYLISGASLFVNQRFIRKIFKKLIWNYLSLYDLITSLKKPKLNSCIKNPKKILIANISALGDAIINTSIFPIIKSHFPNAKLFFLGTTYTKPLIENCSLIERVFSFDHMRINRKKISFIKKIYSHLITRKSFLKQIKKEKIDLAIDFSFDNPNSIKLLHKAKIPNILGYTNGGYKHLLNIKINKPLNPFWHRSTYHIYLLNALLEKKEEIRPLEPFLPPIKEPRNKKLKKYENKDFIIIHTGASHKSRFLTLNQTKQILDIIPKDILILFVGLGKEEHRLIEKIIKDIPNCINLANKLHILDLIYLCSKAKMTISTDSAIAHIASCFDYPQIVFFKNPNITHQNLWCLNKPNIKINNPDPIKSYNQE